MNHAAFYYGRKLEAKQGSFSPDLAMDLALHVASVCLMFRVQASTSFTASTPSPPPTATSAARLMEFKPGIVLIMISNTLSQ